jgi:hypothetical protein
MGFENLDENYEKAVPRLVSAIFYWILQLQCRFLTRETATFSFPLLLLILLVSMVTPAGQICVLYMVITYIHTHSAHFRSSVYSSVLKQDENSIALLSVFLNIPLFLT